MKTYIATYFNMHAISYFIENVALHTTLVLRVQEDWLLKTHLKTTLTIIFVAI